MIENQVHARIESVADRVYPNQAPNGVVLPYIVYTIEDGEPQRHLGGSGSLTKHVVQVEAWADTLAQANALLSSVKLRLDGYQGGNIHRALCTDPGQGQQEEDGYHKVATYSVWVVTANITPTTDATAVIRTGDSYAEIIACDHVLRLDCDGLKLDGEEVGANIELPDLTPYARTDLANTFTDENTFSGTVTVSGSVTATSFSGNGASVTSLNASNLTTGTVADARLSSNVAFVNTANTFTANQIIVGSLTVRQSGGTAGTDEMNISHDGTRTTITSKDGGVRVQARSGVANNEKIFEVTRADGSNGDLDAVYAYLSGSQVFLSVPFINVRQSYDSDVRIRLGSSAGVSFSNGFINGGTRSGLRDGGAMGVVDLFGGTDGARANASGATLASAMRSPSQITSDQNNYDPAGGNGHYRNYRLNSDASRNITGLVPAPDGTEIRIFNVGSNNIVLKHQDTNSTAANRMICSGAADITLVANDGAEAFYDNTTARWRVWKL